VPVQVECLARIGWMAAQSIQADQVSGRLLAVSIPAVRDPPWIPRARRTAPSPFSHVFEWLAGEESAPNARFNEIPWRAALEPMTD
jgi:hypothetical protein